MTLKDYQHLFFKRLNSKINKNEIKEYFFWITEHYCEVNRLKYILNPDFILNKIQELNLLDAINHLQKNMPIQYIVGETEFLNLKFLLTKKK